MSDPSNMRDPSSPNGVNNAVEIASHFAAKLLSTLRQEPRKVATLTILVTFLTVIWFKALSGQPVLPAGAVASIISPTVSDLPAPTVSDVSPELTKWRKQSPRPMSRNLFQIQYERFPEDGAAHPSQSAQKAFWDQIANSMDIKADQEKARNDSVVALRSEAAKLRPKATLNVNGVRTALIDGSLVSEGDVIKGFRILRIASDRIVVEKDGMRLEIKDPKASKDPN